MHNRNTAPPNLKATRVSNGNWFPASEPSFSSHPLKEGILNIQEQKFDYSLVPTESIDLIKTKTAEVKIHIAQTAAGMIDTGNALKVTNYRRSR